LIAVAGVIGLVVAGASLAATMRVTSRHPLVLRGSGFKANELVRVIVTRGSDVRTRRVRAGARGRFVVRFRTTLQDCPPWLIVARGNRGSRALLRSDPRIDCASP
jgi:hypothetical protein